MDIGVVHLFKLKHFKKMQMAKLTQKSLLKDIYPPPLDVMYFAEI